jgi:hypothetical protein
MLTTFQLSTMCWTRHAEETIRNDHHKQDQEMNTTEHTDHEIMNVAAFLAKWPLQPHIIRGGELTRHGGVWGDGTSYEVWRARRNSKNKNDIM